MKKYDACLVGYYGMQNTGDDALMAGAAWGARNVFQAENIAATTPRDVQLNRQTQFSATTREPQQYTGQNRLLRYKLGLQSKHVIFGGGSVFHTKQDIDIKRHMMSLSGGGDHVAVGVSLGPFENVAAEKACAKFLNQCIFTGLRDQQSYDLAKAIAPNANFAKTFDLAPLLLCSESRQIQPVERSGIAINICPRESLQGKPEQEEQRINRLVQALVGVYQQTGEPINLFVMNGHESLGDFKLLANLKSKLANFMPVSLIDYDPNPARVMQRLGTFKAVVSMRLHGSILAFLAETPHISLNYHTKSTGWCNQIGLHSSMRFDVSNIDPFLLEKVLVHGLEYGFPQVKLPVSTAVQFAKKNWNYLCQELAVPAIA